MAGSWIIYGRTFCEISRYLPSLVAGGYGDTVGVAITILSRPLRLTYLVQYAGWRWEGTILNCPLVRCAAPRLQDLMRPSILRITCYTLDAVDRIVQRPPRCILNRAIYMWEDHDYQAARQHSRSEQFIPFSTTCSAEPHRSSPSGVTPSLMHFLNHISILFSLRWQPQRLRLPNHLATARASEPCLVGWPDGWLHRESDHPASRRR